MASDRSESPYQHEIPARWEAEDEALRRGRPVTREDEAAERGYVKGDDDHG